MDSNLLEKNSIHAWIEQNGIKTDTGLPLDFKNHAFMWDIYSDMSPLQAGMKAAQVTWSTMATLKAFWLAKMRGMDIIYTLPSESDRNDFVGSKVNRIIAQNPILQSYTKDKDSVEQKQVGNSFIHYRGTWTQRAAIMVPSDCNIYDEIDSSKQTVIEQYATRLQHSSYRWEWAFSHPSAPGFGVDRYWQRSDQKHWLIKCKEGHEQYLSWDTEDEKNMSVNIEKEIFVCKKCGSEILDDIRRKGRWARKLDRVQAEVSGYWVSLLMCPWVSAKDIVGYYKNKSQEYFINKVLGLPFIGGDNKLTWEMFAKNLTNSLLQPSEDEMVVIGVDTGLKIDYVMGGLKGLFFHGEAKDYDELDKHMKRWPRAIAVVDAGGDLIGSRKFKNQWPGRVYLCFTGGSGRKEELTKQGSKEELFTFHVDRNSTIQLVVGEFREGLIPVQGNESDWYDYWTDWNNLTRVRVDDPVTMEVKGYKWVRSGRDHRAMATVYWRAGMMKMGLGRVEFIGERERIGGGITPAVNPNNTMPALTPLGEDLVTASLRQLNEPEEDDWRNV